MTDGDTQEALDPRELARRLAEQAKAKAKASASEDPRELARRLAEEAKAKAKAPEDPRELARRLAEEAKAKAAGNQTNAAEATPAIPPRRSLFERARKRPMTAMEALRQAADQERLKQEARAAAEEEARKAEAEALRVAEEAKRAAAEEAQRAAEAATAAAEAASAAAAEAPPVAEPPVRPSAAPPEPVVVHGMDPSEVASLKLRDVEVLGVSTIADRAVFRALWKAHRARAKADGDIGLLVTADVLLDAANRVPSGALHALHILSDGRPYAAWVDGDRQVMLGVTPTPDIFLAGL